MRAEHDMERDANQERLESRPTSAHGFHLSDVRAANRACILRALEGEGPLSRIALARRLGLSRTTVSHIVAELLSEGRVREDGELPASESGGRRATLLRLCETETDN
jgi:hypothetical protein